MTDDLTGDLTGTVDLRSGTWRWHVDHDRPDELPVLCLEDVRAPGNRMCRELWRGVLDELSAAQIGSLARSPQKRRWIDAGVAWQITLYSVALRERYHTGETPTWRLDFHRAGRHVGSVLLEHPERGLGELTDEELRACRDRLPGFQPPSPDEGPGGGPDEGPDDGPDDGPEAGGHG